MRELDQTQWTVAERAELALKGWRSRREGAWTQRTQWDEKTRQFVPLDAPREHIGEWPPVSSIIRPADYMHDFNRGTIAYSPEWRNYSYHTVRIAPNTVVRDCNFSQIEPNTLAIIITGQPDSVTFIDCNLCDVKLNPNWVLQDCNTVQSWLVKNTVKDFEGNDVEVEDREWLCAHPRDLPAVVVKPPNAVISRNF